MALSTDHGVRERFDRNNLFVRDSFRKLFAEVENTGEINVAEVVCVDTALPVHRS